jgi:hypothetical protein
MKPRDAALAILILGGLARPASAWTPETRIAIADEAVRLMPPSLRLVLERHRQDVIRGAIEPLAHEDDRGHLAPDNDGTLDRSVASAAEDLVRSIDGAQPIRQIAYRFGLLAHFVSDAGFPPGVGAPGIGRRYADFAKFCETRRARFPLVFYGHEDPYLAHGEFAAFARGAIARARVDGEALARAYTDAGTPPAPAAFDDRSVPFAIGSLSYSHSVTDVVRAWLAAWGGAHGDMTGTPYGKAP